MSLPKAVKRNLDMIFDHVAITYLVKGTCQAYAVEARTHIVENSAEIDLNTFAKDGMWLPEDEYIPPAAIIRVQRCNGRGYPPSHYK